MELYILLGPRSRLGVVPLFSQRALLFKKKKIQYKVDKVSLCDSSFSVKGLLIPFPGDGITASA